MDKLIKLLRKKDTVKKSALYYGKDLEPIPIIPTGVWMSEVVAAFTGPNAGLTQLDLVSNSTPGETSTAIAGSTSWNNPTEYAFGFATSLYEEDKREVASSAESTREMGTGRAERSSFPALVGEPVADVFGIQVRENSAILALADGVSWGRKARLAARCAVHAVMEHISSNLSQIERKPDSHTITQLLLDSVVLKAQELIMKNKATLTTLSAVVVCEMAACPGEWGLFVVAVGDSPVYVYCPHTKSLTEVTVGCHAHNGERDLRMAGGTLGPSHGSQPDLENLSVAYLPVYAGDIVFCASDGVSDNFSPRASSESSVINCNSEHPNTPRLKPCCENIVNMTEVLTKHQDDLGQHLSAQTVVARLVNHAVEVTEIKRQFRSDCLVNDIDIRRKSKEDPEFSRKVQAITGKLDHAAVVAYQVGHHSQN